LNVIDQAQRYLAAIPPAVSGSNGHNQTFSVAMALVEGFALSSSEAKSLMMDYSQRCSPPWSEKDIDHKLKDAESKAESAKRGKLIRRGVKYQSQPKSAPVPMGKVTPEVKPARYEVSDATELPDPVPDGTRQFIMAAFQPGEGVRIAQARTGDDGREIPKDAGITLSREEWLKKLDASKGNPNAFLKTSDRNGIFVSVNPMRIGGSKDADVTDLRHALLEFDEISREEQWGIIVQSQVPCTAIISSGRKSIHAWVKIDAKDRREFDERTKALYQHFSDYRPDEKNKNPSRFSRLPGCERGQSRQELLALNIGCDSFTEWLKFIESDSLGKCFEFSELLSVDITKDPNCVIGFRDGKTLRYLCRGKSAWLIGPSGIGKSSLLAEFAMAWANGQPCFGIEPARPLRSLIIQAENDFYDLAEMVQGIARAHNIGKDDFDFDVINENIKFKSETTSVREHFVERMHRLIDREKPDIVWADPLLSFAGIDVAKQNDCTMFLREWMNPVLESTGVVLIGIHHTGKPKNTRDTANWTALDWAYSGLGSSELVNWARAVMVLKPIDDHNFELKMAKRGARAGAKHPNGDFTTSVFLRHDISSIRWHQQPAPEAPEPSEHKGGKPNDKERVAAMNLHDFCQACQSDGEGLNVIARRLESWLAKQGEDLSLPTCKRIVPLLVKNGKLSKGEDAKYRKGKQA
jgi:hypothetical protein